MIQLFTSIEELKKRLPTETKTLFLADSNTYLACFNLLGLVHPCFVFEAGESQKNLNQVEVISHWMAEHYLSRNDTLYIIGGGVACDMGGLCASLYMRGINFVLIPTSLLAMIDASIGGKVAVNLDNLKNYVGVFNKPTNVYICTPFLKSLPKIELLNGYGEMCKHALLQGLNEWHKLISVKLEDILAEQWVHIINESVQFKRKVVESDFKETGRRKILNFGHTIGHAVESRMMQTNRAIGHGIAVAVGLIAELHLSKSIFIQPDDEWSEVIQFITARFQQFCPVLTEDDIHAVCDLLIFDKKNANGKTLFVLLNGIGNPEYDVPCSETDVQNALEFYNVQIRL